MIPQRSSFWYESAMRNLVVLFILCFAKSAQGRKSPPL
jgi:hypothetical protein